MLKITAFFFASLIFSILSFAQTLERPLCPKGDDDYHLIRNEFGVFNSEFDYVLNCKTEMDLILLKSDDQALFRAEPRKFTLVRKVSKADPLAYFFADRVYQAPGETTKNPDFFPGENGGTLEFPTGKPYTYGAATFLIAEGRSSGCVGQQELYYYVAKPLASLSEAIPTAICFEKLKKNDGMSAHFLEILDSSYENESIRLAYFKDSKIFDVGRSSLEVVDINFEKRIAEKRASFTSPELLDVSCNHALLAVRLLPYSNKIGLFFNSPSVAIGDYSLNAPQLDLVFDEDDGLGGFCQFRELSRNSLKPNQDQSEFTMAVFVDGKKKKFSFLFYSFAERARKIINLRY